MVFYNPGKKKKKKIKYYATEAGKQPIEKIKDKNIFNKAVFQFKNQIFNQNIIRAIKET